MTGHFLVTGTPEEIEYKEYGQEGKELARFKCGYFRFQTFSETVIHILRDRPGDALLMAGDYREREYDGKIYTDAIVSAVWPAKSKQPKQQPKHDDSDLPF